MECSSSRLARLALLVFSLQQCLAISGGSFAFARAGLQPQELAARSTQGSITIAVEATEAPRKILLAQLTILTKPGPLTLLYPKWIPGELGPTGPITDLAGLNDLRYVASLRLPEGWKFGTALPAVQQAGIFGQLIYRFKPVSLTAGVGNKCRDVVLTSLDRDMCDGDSVGKILSRNRSWI